MLARTANSLFWMARYMERMNYVARLMEVGLRMGAVGGTKGANEWQSALVAAGVEAAFFENHHTVTPAHAMDYLARDPKNSSSILSCIEAARFNGRAVRGALTSDMWDAINSTWHEARDLADREFTVDTLPQWLDWVKTRSALFNGAYMGTMLKNDGFSFTRLGTFIERADNTARLLDVKYHVLLPEHSGVGGVVDYSQWTAILRSASALRAYSHVYKDRVTPWNVAEILILNPQLPRSLRACYDQITRDLDLLEDAYGGRSGEPHRMAGALHARLRYGRVEDVFQAGLHEFLTGYVDQTAALGGEIAAFYLMQ